MYGKHSWYGGEPKYQWKKPQVICPFIEEHGNLFLGLIVAVGISLLMWAGLIYGFMQVWDYIFNRIFM